MDRLRGLPIVFAISLCLAWLSACGHRPPDHAAPEPRANPSAELLAGAAKVDITPIAGVPLGGHSFEGGTGYAVWTRLWARAIYVEDAHGEPLVLAVADLWSIPAGLADAVVARVREHHGLTHIGRAQLLLSATHTHHSPANFSTAKLYSRAASRRMGFDPELFEFLTHRIADAVAAAATARAPARLRLDTRPVAGLARNRSLAPFAADPEAALIVAHNQAAGLPGCPAGLREGADLELELDPCHAVDPTLTSLRIEDLDGRPMAIAAFFAVHATSMLNATDVYNGDLFAVATTRAEAALAQAHGSLATPVVALFNGPEGDISPDWDAQGRATALELGARLGEAIIAAGIDGRGPVEIDGAIESGFRRIPLADQPVEGPPATATAGRSLGGRAILGGAEDGRTKYHARWPEGQTVDRPRRAGQGPKKPAVAPGLYELLFPRSMVPQEVPAAVHRLGPLTFVGLPGEFTTVMGMRVRQAVAARSAPGAPRPIAIGLANEYLSYFVTPEEYALQHYEGGSTLWGQYAGTLMAEQIAALAGEVAVDRPAVPEASAGPSARFDPGLRRRFALEPGARARRTTRDLPATIHAQLELETALDELPRLRVETGAPSWRGLTWPELRVEVEAEDGSWRPLARAGAVVDERGTEVVMIPVEVGRHRWTWELWWIGEVPGGQTLRLHSWGPDGADWCSAPFTAAGPPALDPLACRKHGEAWVGPVADVGIPVSED